MLVDVLSVLYFVTYSYRYSLRQVTSLEYSQYLDNYLWRHFTRERANPAFLLSICLMVNQKWRQGVLPWKSFEDQPTHFPQFMHAVMEAALANLKVSVVLFMLLLKETSRSNFITISFVLMTCIYTHFLLCP